MASVGIMIEPFEGLGNEPGNGSRKGLTLGADFWWVRLRNEIDVLSADTVLEDADRFGSRIVRCSQLDAGSRSRIATCLNYPAFDPIAFVDTPIENLGRIRTRGVDLALAFDTGPSADGAFSFSFEATYVDRYDAQRFAGGAVTGGAGRYADDVPIFRWQHTAQLDWSHGPWTTSLSQRYKSGYADQQPGHRVRPYSLVDLSLGYTGIKHTTLSVGLKNLFDTRPPFSNQDETRQPNYDPRFTDPNGRALTFRIAYRFF